MTDGSAGLSPLAQMFAAADSRTQPTVKRGDATSYFGDWDASGATLGERSKWLRDVPSRYAALAPGGQPLLEETAEIAARDWDVRGIVSVRDLGMRLEPDVLLFGPNEQGVICLLGGALCFPTGWSLEENLRRPLDEIPAFSHALNTGFDAPLHELLPNLTPGTVLLRDDWTIAATDELNLHPTRRLPSPSFPVMLDRLWLRVEHRALLTLPRAKGIIVAIRIALHRLDDVARDREAAPRLRQALASMPPDVAEYKRVAGIKSRLIQCV